MDIENKYGVRKIQEGLLDLLKKFDAVCQEKGIRYTLDSGTLLGAIRHQGFIPWDDDVDIVVDRKNYESLVETFKGAEDFVFFTDLWMPRIQLKEWCTAENVPTLDVFIFDPAPDNVVLRKLKVFLIYCCQALMKKPATKEISLTNLRLLIGYILGRPFSYETKLNWYFRLSQFPRNTKTKFLSCYNYWPSSCINLLFRSDILDHIERRPFENIELNAVCDHDSYLTTLYGDYMTPPKETDRKPEHQGERTIRHF